MVWLGGETSDVPKPSKNPAIVVLFPPSQTTSLFFSEAERDRRIQVSNELGRIQAVGLVDHNVSHEPGGSLLHLHHRYLDAVFYVISGDLKDPRCPVSGRPIPR